MISSTATIKKIKEEANIPVLEVDNGTKIEHIINNQLKSIEKEIEIAKQREQEWKKKFLKTSIGNLTT